MIEKLVRDVVFEMGQARQDASRKIWSVAQEAGIYPASIEEHYRALSHSAVGAAQAMTIPAVNMRALPFFQARGVFRAMKAANTQGVIFELSRGEIGFTGQRPHEYAANILGAALVEGYSGPVFLQGDHFQISPSRYAVDPKGELATVKALIREGVAAGFYNIDIDASAIGDGSQACVKERLRPNAELTAELIIYARELDARGATLSLGGEIGEIGELNSTPEEMHTYLSNVAERLPSTMAGLSKISIQSGTRHGGNILADGSVGDMPIDFDLITDLSKIAKEYGLGGCVQHGASMLSMAKLGQLAAAGCIEVHLAAAFLNVVYDTLPKEVVQQADEWIDQNHKDEWKEGWSRAQFLHHARRYPVGPFKELWWRQSSVHEELTLATEEVMRDYITRLNIANATGLVEAFATEWNPIFDGKDQDHSMSDLAS